jgi:DNA-binding NarL/FixJ family response regulator
LIERDAQLSILTNMLADGAAGRGSVALVQGPIASGKTTLLRVFGDQAVAAGSLFLQATASRAEQDQPFGVMGQLLLGADLPAGDADVAVHLLDKATNAMMAEEAPKNVIPKLCGPLLAQARKRLVALTVDDVHSADSNSVECLLYLARRLPTSRLVAVLAENGDLLPDNPRFRAELLRQPICRKIRLELLSVHGVAELIAAEEEGRGRRASPPVSDCYRLTGGSPLLVRALLEDYQTGAASAGLVPGGAFAQAITTCLYRTDAATRRVAQGAAVLGPKTPQAKLAEVLGTSCESVDRSLGVLAEAGLLMSGWFRHGVAHAAVLQSMERPERARLEARVAEVLNDHGETATELARHLIVAEPIEAQWVLPTLLEAADRALADDEVELALDCLRAARNASSDERQTLSIKAALIRAGWRLNPSLAARHLPELTTAALAGRLDARHVNTLIGYLLWFGQVDRALDVFTVFDARVAGERTATGRRPRTLGSARSPESARTLRLGSARGAGSLGLGSARSSARLGTSSFASVPSSPGFDFLRMILAYGYPGLPGRERPASPAPAAAADAAQGAQQRVVALLSALLARGPEDDPVLLAEQILQGSRLDDRNLATIVAALIALVFADGLGEAAAWCDTLIKEAISRRAPMWQALFASARAFIGVRLGRMDVAEESARTALTLVSPEEWGVVITAPLSALVYAQTARGALDHAAAGLSIPVPDAAFQTPGGLLYLQARGHYYLAAGRPYAALDDFHACGDLMIKWGLDRPPLVPWRTDAAQAYLALGDRLRAESLAEEQLARVGQDDSAARGVSLRVLATVSDLERRPELLNEAEAILWKRGHQFELALATQELARTYRELGDESQARTLARKALRLMRKSGVVDAAPSEPDGEPEPEFRSPLELSDAELRVATLAVRGHTNRQIADQLFITVSTVEQHLTRIYRKLDVRRRTDLAAKLRLDAAGRSEEHGTGTVRSRLCAG